ncbi:traK family protein, partial [Escherichia coli 2-177-06_S3_C2]
MRKNNTAIIFGGLFFSCSVMAGAGTLAPTVVPMVNGGQASIAISNTSPNLFTVPGDRIIAVNSLDGALTNNEQTASGGVVVTVVVPGRAEPASLPVSDSPFTALKLENGWVETPGHSVSDSAKVFASVTQMAMDNTTLNGLARSGRDVRLYSSLDETR